MKQPDTAALRERLANYTPEDEQEQDKLELEGLLQDVNSQIAELRNLLNEINSLKEELHGIHGSLKHTSKGNGRRSMLYLRQRTVRTISCTASAVPLPKQNSTPSSMPQSVPMNWRKCINAQPNISRPKKNCWKSTAIKWPNASKAMKVFGYPISGSAFGLLYKSYFA